MFKKQCSTHETLFSENVHTFQKCGTRNDFSEITPDFTETSAGFRADKTPTFASTHAFMPSLEMQRAQT